MSPFTERHKRICHVEITDNKLDVLVYRDTYGSHDCLGVCASTSRYVKSAQWMPNGAVRVVIHGPVRDEVRDYTGIEIYHNIVYAI